MCCRASAAARDRKSTRLNSSHSQISYADFCLKKNTIERGRAWHWRLLPAGWADTAFILRHGQLKTKRAFARFFPDLAKTAVQPPKRPMRINQPSAGDAPLAWETVRMVFAQNPKLKKL